VKGNGWHPRSNTVSNHRFKSQALSVKVWDFQPDDGIDLTRRLSIIVTAFLNPINEIAAPSIRKRTDVSQKFASIVVRITGQRFFVLELSTFTYALRPQSFESDGVNLGKRQVERHRTGARQPVLRISRPDGGGREQQSLQPPAGGGPPTGTRQDSVRTTVPPI